MSEQKPPGLPICVELVFAMLEESNGHRYTCAALAKRFKRPASDMRPYLIEILARESVRTAVSGRDRLYWVPTQAELDAEKIENTPMKPFTPMVGYEAAMRAAADRRG